MMNELVNPPSWRNDTVLPLPPQVRADAVAVDAACSGNPGPMEYQGIDLALVFLLLIVANLNDILRWLGYM